MTKDKKGITLVSLVVTLIVMLIIFSVTLISATVILDNSKLTKIETTLYMAKARAEVLLEQYMFDGNVKPLIYFSTKVEKKLNPIGYYCNTDSSGKIIESTTKFSCTETRVNKISNYKETYTIQLISNTSFTNKIKSIYSNYNEQMEKIKYDTNGVPVTGADGTTIVKEKVGRYLFVKWGVEECLSQGIYKNNSNGTKNNDAIVNENDYIIVVYDLASGNVSVAYSKGYRSDNKILYTLDSMLKIDENAE